MTSQRTSPNMKVPEQGSSSLTPFQVALGLYMKFNNVTARALQRSLGIDHTAVSRFVNGKDISLANYNLLLSWFVSKPNNPPVTEVEKAGLK